jgi:hypothetical protein
MLVLSPRVAQSDAAITLALSILAVSLSSQNCRSTRLEFRVEFHKKIVF